MVERLGAPNRMRAGPERPLEERVEEAYATSVAQNEAVQSLPQTEIRTFILAILTEIDTFEEVAREDPALRGLTPELAASIGAIWTFSGPGTYYEPTKNDRYQHLSWARGMDRSRLNYTAYLTRKIAERSSGVVSKARPGTVQETIRQNKNMIREHGPHIIYNGTPLENDAVLRVLSEEGTVIPAENVSVVKDKIDNTIDQIKTFQIPKDALERGKKLAIVSHAPHLSRILRMINRYQPLPQGTEIVLFPLPTPQAAAGEARYDTLEACALVYYTYLSPTKDSTVEPYAYTVYTPHYE